ncbi:MAG: hypothetical protein ACRYGF_13825, partial [Janthinobacterium lividum]
MDQLLPVLAPSALVSSEKAHGHSRAEHVAVSDGNDEASILFEERETERAGGAPAEGTLSDVQSALRPELLAQLA